MAFPKVGNMAPAFTLLDQNDKKVSLKDYRDKKNVVLYFYPRAMTPGRETCPRPFQLKSTATISAI